MKSTPLLPHEDARETALFFVVCALCFLAALSALSARAAYSAAESWTSEVTGQITIRVEGGTPELDAAYKVTSNFPGIASARILTQDDAETLLSPWLGANGVPEGLPLPRLIAAESVAGAQEIGPALSARLKDAGLVVTVDDHVKWAEDVQIATRSARFVALGAVALLTATAVAVIAFATHAALLARKEIVDVLHLCGARDGFIAGLFERRFLGLGVQAGALGSGLAFCAAAFMLYAARQSPSHIWLLPQLSLSMVDGLILGLTPVIAGLVSMMAARLTVMRSLSQVV